MLLEILAIRAIVIELHRLALKELHFMYYLYHYFVQTGLCKSVFFTH